MLLRACPFFSNDLTIIFAATAASTRIDPIFQQRPHRLNAIGLRIGEIVRFTGIFDQVEQSPTLASVDRDQLILIVAYCRLERAGHGKNVLFAFHRSLEHDRFAAFFSLALKKWKHVDPIEYRLIVSRFDSSDG